jgi:hypothetical protein
MKNSTTTSNAAETVADNDAQVLPGIQHAGLHENGAEREDSDVSEEEIALLERTDESMATQDDQDVFNAELDNRDNDGELLNETINTSGSDLDVPGADNDDDDAEDEADTDEENSIYSLGGDDND